MIYAFLPFMSAAFYGLGYILLERILKSVDILSYMISSSIVFTSFLIIIAFIRRDEISLSFLSDKKMLGLFLLTFLANAGGWLITLNSLKENSATYTAFAEISYPLFVLIFLFLLFGVRQWNFATLVGGCLVFAGSVILVAAQTSAGKS